MKNSFEQIVHKLWLIDYHKNKQDIFIKNSIEKMHYFWLREHLQELKVCSSHISYENLREFAVENLLKNGYIYYYKLDPKKYLVHVRDLEISKDFVAEQFVAEQFVFQSMKKKLRNPLIYCNCTAKSITCLGGCELLRSKHGFVPLLSRQVIVFAIIEGSKTDSVFDPHSVLAL